MTKQYKSKLISLKRQVMHEVIERSQKNMHCEVNGAKKGGGELHGQAADEGLFVRYKYG